MVTDAIRSVLAEPPARNPTGPRPRDWALVAVLVGAALVEGAVRPDVAWRPVATAIAVALAFTLPWRRTHPLAAVAVAFGTVALLDVATIVASEDPTGLYSMAYLILLMYALLRWGSGRDVLVGVAILVVPVSLGIHIEWTGVGDAIGAVAFVLTCMTLGVAVRIQADVRARELERVKLLEREQLARELHDTVAHHVSAIAVQAQAGRTLAPDRPEAALRALEIIENAASETLADMRAMVRILRNGGEADLAPRRGMADIARLADRAGERPRIDVEVSADPEGLAPAVDTAVFRLAQESITNALRHARGATLVEVRVSDVGESVHLRVHDDGTNTHSGAAVPSGYGLVGMAERARLLGGTCVAGPDPAGGWTVTAVLPRVACGEVTSA